MIILRCDPCFVESMIYRLNDRGTYVKLSLHTTAFRLIVRAKFQTDACLCNSTGTGFQTRLVYLYILLFYDDVSVSMVTVFSGCYDIRVLKVPKV